MRREPRVFVLFFAALAACGSRPRTPSQLAPAVAAENASVMREQESYTSAPTPFGTPGPAALAADLAFLAERGVGAGRVGDGRLSDAAAVIAERGTDACDDIALLMSLSQAAGIPNPLPQALCVTASDGPSGARALAAEFPAAFAQLHTSHVGIAGAERAGVYTFVALLDSRKLKLAPVARRLSMPGHVQVQAEVQAPLRDPELVLTLPSGATQALTRSRGRSLRADVPLLDRGLYGIEIVAHGPHGPQVLANLRVAVATNEPAFQPIPRGERVANAEEFARAVHVALADERARRKLPPLAANRALDAVARAHAEDMRLRGYFGHLDPERRGPMERITKAGLSAISVHENLARVATPSEAHALWLESPAHRAALLSDDAKEAGIGAVRTEDGGYFVVALYATLALPRTKR